MEVVEVKPTLKILEFTLDRKISYREHILANCRVFIPRPHRNTVILL